MNRFLSARRVASFWLILLAMHLGASLALATDLLAIDFDGNLWDVDKTTGAASNSRATGIPQAIDIAFGLDGRLFSADAETSPGSQLYTIDPLTGTATPVGATGLSSLIEGGLTFSPAGTLYGAWVNNNPNNGLVTFNTTTGAATAVGDMVGADDVSALVYTPGGTLYALSPGTNTGQSAIYTIDPNTGAILTTTNMNVVFNRALLGAAIDPATGIFYVASSGTNTLYTLDPATGNLTPVGSLGTGITGVSGLAFTPEPASFMLISIAAGLACARRRHH